jgi:non-canonical (house-cleaning) NTP pyrophosphatase
MKVVIASHNPAKIRAVNEAFTLQFPGKNFDFIPASVESGVSDQPFSDKETRHGARNRARNACEMHPGADFWIGLEGGAFGLLTNGIYTREGVYTEALVIALVPFVNELYRKPG